MKAIFFRLPYEVNSCRNFPPELVFTPFHYFAKFIHLPYGLANAILLSPLMKIKDIKDDPIGPYKEGDEINEFDWFPAGKPPRGLLLLYDEERIRPDYIILGFHMDWEGAISQIVFLPSTKEQLASSGFFGSKFADFLVVTSWDEKGEEKYRVEFKGGTNKIIQKILSNIPYKATIIEMLLVKDYFVSYLLHKFTVGIILDKEGIMYEACIPLDLLNSVM